MKRRIRYLFSILLVCTIVLNIFPVTALAEEIDSSPQTEITGDPTPTNEPETEPTPVPDNGPALAPLAETTSIYVSEKGDDTNDGKSKSEAVKTLAHAVEIAPAGQKVIIYVMSDLTMTESARFWDVNEVPRDITITSDPESLQTAEKTAFTISRAEKGFVAVNDQTRGGYNPGLFEVGNGSDLTLENIILDDGHYAAYTVSSGKDNVTVSGQNPYFNQVASRSQDSKPGPGTTTINNKEVENHKIVQDAMITSFDAGSTITLGEGAVLQNYGGMSAVRVANATLIMESGSKILDTKTYVRTKGAGGTGPAGAVWIQSGELIMKAGSEICNMNGRAIYADGKDSTVTIYGSIHDITGNGNMWNGQSGVALHLRNYSKGTLDGEIKNITGNAVYVESHSSYTMNDGSKISDVSGVGIQLFGIAGGEVYMDGEITRVNNSAIHMNMDQNDLKKSAEEIDPLHATIGPNGNIHHNFGNPYGTVTAQTYNGRIDVYGKINSNYSSDRAGITLASNMNTTTVYLHDGAKICNNVAKGTSGVAGAKGTVIMEEGSLVSGNISTGTERGSGIYLERDSRFIMEGGQVTNNASAGGFGGVALKTEEYNVEEIHPYVSLEGGVISGNVMNAQITGEGSDANQYSVTDGTNCDLSIVTGNEYSNISRYLTISDDITIDEPSIYVQKYDFYIERVNDVKLGNAAAACETAVTTKYGGQDKGYLSAVKGSFWYQSGSNVTLTVTDLTYDTTKPLFAAIVPTNEDGTPDSSGEIELWAVTESNHEIKIPLPGSEDGYAVVFVQETNASGIITVIPVSLTAYMGGDGGYDAVVDDEGNIVDEEESASLPRPIFLVKGPQDVTLTELTFVNTSRQQSWTLTKLGDSNYYRFVPNNGSQDVRVQYSDGNTVVTEDKFEPTQDVYKEYTVTIYLGENEGKVQAEASNKYYTVITGPGILTVRAVEDSQDDAVKPVQTTPTTPVQGSAIVVAPANTTYTLNDTGAPLSSNSKPSLLFDSIIDEDVNRTQLLQEKADQFLGSADENRQYEIKYLDLVDADNGNAWIKASGNVTIYWSYPEGTNSDTIFQVLHFEDLHRDGAQSGFDPADIETCNVTKVETVKTTPYGISFEVVPGGFSPFALVWESKDTGTTPGTGGTGTTSGYTLHYVTNGGNHISDETKSSGWTKEYEKLPTPTREGYRFAGWYWDLRLTDPVTGDVSVEKSTVTLYAKWVQSDVPSMLNGDDHFAYIQGYADGTVRPNANITRAQVATIFFRLLDEDVRDQYLTTYNSFQDVTADYWANTAISTMAALGIMNGRNGSTFDPNAYITRAEFAAICARFDDSTVSSSASRFTDISGNWAEEEILRAAALGWIQGYADGTFRPSQYITRGQAVTMINRVLCRMPEDEDDLLPGMRTWTDCQEDAWCYLAIQEATNSHDYITKDEIHETWTDLNAFPNWNQYE